MGSQNTNVDSEGNPLDVEGYNERYGGGHYETEDEEEETEPHDEEAHSAPTPEHLRLQYYHSPSSERHLVEPPIHVLQKGNERMKYCAVGSLCAGSIDLDTVRSIAFQLWGTFGLLDVWEKFGGLYIFKFSTSHGKESVLAPMCWEFGQLPMLVQDWGRPYELQTTPKVIKLWVKFSNVPDTYWSRDGLSYLASSIGKPLFAGKETSRLHIQPFALICVEYAYGRPLPDFVTAIIIDPILLKKVSVRVNVEYPLHAPLN